MKSLKLKLVVAALFAASVMMFAGCSSGGEDNVSVADGYYVSSEYYVHITGNKADVYKKKNNSWQKEDYNYCTVMTKGNYVYIFEYDDKNSGEPDGGLVGTYDSSTKTIKFWNDEYGNDVTAYNWQENEPTT